MVSDFFSARICLCGLLPVVVFLCPAELVAKDMISSCCIFLHGSWCKGYLYHVIYGGSYMTAYNDTELFYKPLKTLSGFHSFNMQYFNTTYSLKNFWCPCTASPKIKNISALPWNNSSKNTLKSTFFKCAGPRVQSLPRGSWTRGAKEEPWIPTPAAFGWTQHASPRPWRAPENDWFPGKYLFSQQLRRQNT